jgi:hypothetical protein
MISELWDKVKRHDAFNIVITLIVSILVTRFLHGNPFSSRSPVLVWGGRNNYNFDFEITYWKFIDLLSTNWVIVSYIILFILVHSITSFLFVNYLQPTLTARRTYYAIVLGLLFFADVKEFPMWIDSIKLIFSYPWELFTTLNVVSIFLVEALAIHLCFRLFHEAVPYYKR